MLLGRLNLLLVGLLFLVHGTSTVLAVETDHDLNVPGFRDLNAYLVSLQNSVNILTERLNAMGGATIGVLRDEEIRSARNAFLGTWSRKDGLKLRLNADPADPLRGITGMCDSEGWHHWITAVYDEKTNSAKVEVSRVNKTTFKNTVMYGNYTMEGSRLHWVCTATNGVELPRSFTEDILWVKEAN